MDKCRVGCKVFTGGEIRHHRDCVFYPESFSKMFDDCIKQRNEDMREFAEWIGERYFFEETTKIWYLYNEIPMRDPVPMFTTSQLLEDFKIWKEEQK